MNKLLFIASLALSFLIFIPEAESTERCLVEFCATSHPWGGCVIGCTDCTGLNEVPCVIISP